MGDARARRDARAMDDARPMGATGPVSGSAPAPTFCGQCGLPLDEPVHAGCTARAILEPPRYCAFCRRRMVVQVTPSGWSARCVAHGTTSSEG